DVAPLRLGTAIKGVFIIYGLTIVTNYILNLWVKAAPIGPWTGENIATWYWFDNVCWMVFALLWCFIFAAVGNWPFTKIQHNLSRGIVATISCWILGWFSIKAVYWMGLGAGWAFPLVGSLYFSLVFFSFTGENWLWGEFTPQRQFGLIIIAILAFTWVMTMTSVRWIPPWWFPFAQMGLATGLFAYLFRKMKQPMKGIMSWLLMFIIVGVWLMISTRMGIWDFKLEGTSGFWNIGSYTQANDWLLLFMIGCSFVYGVLIPLHNWPFTKIRMPWGGILAGIATAVLCVLMTLIFKSLIGPVFRDMNEALTYAYMGVAWSFFIPLFFGIGFEKPYLWTGQKTPGSWEDVD
ncbi:MAG: hypothetical protein JRE40_09150, partial [Deltaproteobacteria bacterium]|nr:hypothetical protein [Deltaproteobacteria bacterium]